MLTLINTFGLQYLVTRVEHINKGITVVWIIKGIEKYLIMTQERNLSN